MNNLRLYGTAPYSIAVIHGGPGAAGDMAPVARELSVNRGILEPMQTADSIKGQVSELRKVIKKKGHPPVILIGFSWGAWLGIIFSARYPEFVKKLILVGCGPFDEKYSTKIQEIRLNRLTEDERGEIKPLLEIMNNPAAEGKKRAFIRFGKLFSKADAYDPDKYHSEKIDYRVDIFQKVWPEAAELRRTGTLLNFAKQIKCPVVAIQGDYDPHSVEGVAKSLSAIIKSFRLMVLNKCGHMPWIERQARVKFFEILKQELI